MRPLETLYLTANMTWLTQEIHSLLHQSDSGAPVPDVNERVSNCFDLLKRSLALAETNPHEMIPSDIWGPDDSQIENFRITCIEGARALASLYGLNAVLAASLSDFLSDHRIFRVGKYRVSRDMFTSRIPIWTTLLSELADRPISVLEIGSADGLATCWLLEHVLTHGDAQIMCIDIPHADHDRLFAENVAASGLGHKVRKLSGRSENMLRSLNEASFEMVYVDASHHQVDVLSDAVMAWRVLKTDGLMILDDYRIKEFFRAKYIVPERPDVAIDAFLSVFAPEIAVVSKGNQVFARKIPRAAS